MSVAMISDITTPETRSRGLVQKFSQHSVLIILIARTGPRRYCILTRFYRRSASWCVFRISRSHANISGSQVLAYQRLLLARFICIYPNYH